MEHQGPLTSPIYSPSTKRNDSLYECCVLGFTQHLLLLSSHSIFLTTWRLRSWIHSWKNWGFGLSQATSENGWGRQEIRSPHCQVDTSGTLNAVSATRAQDTTRHHSCPKTHLQGLSVGSRETGGDTVLTDTRHEPSLPLRHHLSTRPASTGKPRGAGQNSGPPRHCTASKPS